LKRLIQFLSFSLLFLSLLGCFPESLGSSRDRYEEERIKMVNSQIKRRGIRDSAVLSAMETVPRHLFVSPNMRDKAYGDYPLPIGQGQTISQPYIVALMTQYLDLEPTDRVLEIGTGSGYQAAILSLIVDEVYTIEIKKPLTIRARGQLRELGYSNVSVKNDDGYFGWPEKAPFDAIIITCAVNHIPPPLLSQLKDGGRLILPLGSTLYFQTLTLVTKVGEDHVVDHLISVRFVPMLGEAEKKR
jgi:protein-L-isoaspartate(D-aspartate) O-methyltransferase